MGNSIPGVVTKMLTLAPILVAIYYFDLAKFETVFTSLDLLPFFVLTLSLFVFGIVLKRRILAARLELSSVSFTWGIVLLALAVLLYIYGSYSSDTTWYHYESLYVLIVAYVALRIGSGILRALAPLLAILPFSFLPLGLMPDLIHQELLVFLSADLIAVFFILYLRLNARSAVLPLAAISLTLVGWLAYARSLSINPQYLDVLIPVPFVIAVIPRVRRFAFLGGRPPSACSDHHVLPDGFCSICGMKVARARTGENFGLWGLLAVIGVAFLLILASVPALVFENGLPYEAHYAPDGYSSVATPITPTGWQVNSTTPEKIQTDFYSIEQVFVPVFHPETKNYTMYYELAFSGPPPSNGPFGIDIAGWNRTLDQLVQFGPFQGHLNGYVAPGKVFLTYHGTTTMNFLIGGSEIGLAVGLGFTREFHNSNLTEDTAQFLADLNAFWLPNVQTDVSYSGWTMFIYDFEEGIQSTSQSVVTILSIAVLFFVAYRATLSDERLDRFVGIASLQPEARWFLLSQLLNRPSSAVTGQELASNLGGSGPPSAESLNSTLHELEESHLARLVLQERASYLVSAWRADF